MCFPPDLHEDFAKTDLKEAQSHTNYKRIHVDETAQAKMGEVTWIIESELLVVSLLIESEFERRTCLIPLQVSTRNWSRS